MRQKLLTFFTRTPLHIGAGGSDPLIDQPILRERHTGFPIIPGSTLKGTFADLWSGPDGRQGDALWLFGSADPDRPEAGALRFSEAKLVAFPLRSAKGGFGWITCPLILRRLSRDGGLPGFKGDGQLDPDYLPTINLREDQALFDGSTLAFGDKVVLEEYLLTRPRDGARDIPLPPKLAGELSKLMRPDPVWTEIGQRVVVVSDGLMTFFVRSACEIIQHAAVDDSQGASRPGAAFTQENVPSESLFYSCVTWLDDSQRSRAKNQDALETFAAKLAQQAGLVQLGADASSGLGCCTVEFRNPIVYEKP